MSATKIIVGAFTVAISDVSAIRVVNSTPAHRIDIAFPDAPSHGQTSQPSLMEKKTVPSKKEKAAFTKTLTKTPIEELVAQFDVEEGTWKADTIEELLLKKFDVELNKLKATDDLNTVLGKYTGTFKFFNDHGINVEEKVAAVLKQKMKKEIEKHIEDAKLEAKEDVTSKVDDILDANDLKGALEYFKNIVEICKATDCYFEVAEKFLTESATTADAIEKIRESTPGYAKIDNIRFATSPKAKMLLQLKDPKHSDDLIVFIEDAEPKAKEDAEEVAPEEEDHDAKCFHVEGNTVTVRVQDYKPPTPEQLMQVIDWINKEIAERKAVGTIYCCDEGSCGRSGTFMGGLIVESKVRNAELAEDGEEDIKGTDGYPKKGEVAKNSHETKVSKVVAQVMKDVRKGKVASIIHLMGEETFAKAVRQGDGYLPSKCKLVREEESNETETSIKAGQNADEGCYVVDGEKRRLIVTGDLVETKGQLDALHGLYIQLCEKKKAEEAKAKSDHLVKMDSVKSAKSAKSVNSSTSRNH